MLADEGSKLGGSLLFENEEIGGQSGYDWAQGVIAELSSMANVPASAAHHRVWLV